VSESYPANSLPEDVIIADVGDGEIRSLTRELVRGDEAAWREFHHLYQLRLRSYLRVLWHGQEEALDDLSQETFLRAVKHIRIFDDESALWSWLTVLARSAVADAGRKQSRRFRFLEKLSSHLSTIRAAPPIEPGEGFDRALASLSAEPARLLRLKYEESRTTRQIAEILGVTEKAAERRLARARAQLRKQLQKHT